MAHLKMYIICNLISLVLLLKKSYERIACKQKRQRVLQQLKIFT